MATAIPRISVAEIELPKDHKLPGHTVDALLAVGDVAGARSELERLIDAGASEGNETLTEITPEYWEGFITRAKQRVLGSR